MQRNNASLIPLTIHFLLELSMWLWLLLAGILKNIVFLLLFVATIFIFWGFSAKDDPVKKTKFKTPGIMVLCLELFSFIVGIVACFALFGTIGLIFEGLFTIVSYALNYQRVLWLLGLKSEVPETLLVFSKMKQSEN